MYSFLRQLQLKLKKQAEISQEVADMELADDWQVKKNLVDCNRHMFEKEISCDIKFRVGTDDVNSCLVPAHKYILVSRSPVFYAMFCGQLAAKENDTIRVSDIEEVAFRHMLKYMYCDEVNLSSDVVLPILYASKKYMLPILTDKCIHYLEDNLQPSNVCTIYEHSILYDVDRLIQKCVSFIETRTDDILTSTSFCDIGIESLLKILRFERLTISELDLFKACSRWAEEECRRKDLEVCPANQREVLGDALYLVHFPALTLPEFANCVSQTGILTAEEKCRVYDFMACDDAGVKTQVTKNMVFPTSKREKPKPSVLKRFQNFTKSSVYSGDCNILKVQCDQTIIIKGFGVSGSCNFDPLSEIQVVIKQDRSLLCNRSITIHDDQSQPVTSSKGGASSSSASDNIIKVALPDTIVLKPHVWYTVITTFHFFGDHDQGSCRRGKGGSKTISCDGAVFEFDRADSAGFVAELYFCKM